MPKIFLIKNRLHQQQQRLLESQNLLQHKSNEDDRLVPPLSPPTPLPAAQGSKNDCHSSLTATSRPRPLTPTPTRPAPTPPTPIQPSQIPEPQDKQQQRAKEKETVTSPEALVVKLRSSSPASVAEPSSSATTIVTSTPAESQKDEEQPLSLVARSQQPPQQPPQLQPPLQPRKRFHHRRHYFGQQRNFAGGDNNTSNDVEQVGDLVPKDQPLANVIAQVPVAATTAATACTTPPPPPPPSSVVEKPLANTQPILRCSTEREEQQEDKDCRADAQAQNRPKAQSPKHKIVTAETQAEVLLDQSTTELEREVTPTVVTKPRFVSSILGGSKPYSGGVVLTQAQRKEYPLEVVSRRCRIREQHAPSVSESDSDSDGSKLIVDEKPLVPEEKPLSLRLRNTPPPVEQRPSPPPPPEPAVRCSVIQRAPNTCTQPSQRLLPASALEHLGPEQQEPINYHVPKRRSASCDSDEERTDALSAKRLERERKLREARRRSAILAARAVLAQARLNPRFVRNLPGILAAAAGHGRASSSTGAGQGFQGAGGFGSSGAGAGSNQSGGAGSSPTGYGGTIGGSGSSGVGGGSGGGGMGGGRDGRNNYAPNSPPSGALPPFYESLKGGNNASSSAATHFNGNPNFLIQNAAAAAYLMSAAAGGGSNGAGGSGGPGQHFVDCNAQTSNGNGSGGGGSVGGATAGLESTTNIISTFANGQGNASFNALAPHSKFHNNPSSPATHHQQHHQHHHHHAHLPYGPNPSAYGIILKDEPDIEYDEAKIDIGVFAQNIMQATLGNPGNFNAAAYEDAIMSDLATTPPNGGVDPLQFTATLMLSSQTDHLLDQLSDAVDLSSFLQRECADDENSISGREEFELVSTPSLTPDSVSITPVEGGGGSNGTHLDAFDENLMQQLTSNIARSQMGAAGSQPHNGQGYVPFERQSHNQHGVPQHSGQQQPPPSYQHATRDLMQLQQQQSSHIAPSHGYSQQQQHPMLSHGGLALPQHQQQQQQAYHHQHQQMNPYAPTHQPQQVQHQQQQPHMPHHLQQQQHHQQHQPQQQHHSHHHHSQQQQQHPHHHHNSDSSNLSLPSPSTVHMSGHHHMSSAASSSSSGASTSGLLDHATAMLEAKPLIQSVSLCRSIGISQAGFSSGLGCASSPSSSLRSAATAVAAVAASAVGLLPASPTVAKLGDRKGLQSRLGLPSEVQIEFVNGGHGIKNPLAVENTHVGHHHRMRSIDCLDDLKKGSSGGSSSGGSSLGAGGGSQMSTADASEGDGSKFVCRICLKSFALQRLLNRHMKCHSEIKRYLCTFCGKGFNDTFDLKRHTRTHTGVRPYKCDVCEKSFTQRCSLESHCLKVHSVQHQYAYKERRVKVYVCEECGHTTCEPELHYIHLKENHPYSPALLKFYDKRHFKFTNSQFANNLLGQLPMPVHN